MNSEAYFLNILYERGSLVKNINNYLYFDNGSGYNKLVKLCKNKPRIAEFLNLGCFFRNKFDEPMLSKINVSRLTLEKNILLWSALFITEQEKIVKFLVLKKQFEQYVLVRDYTNASNLLEECYKTYGLSLWLLENCSLLKMLDDIHFEFLNDLSKFEKAYLNIFNIKNNLNERQDYYVKRMRDNITSEAFHERCSSFIRYILCIDLPKKDEDWKNILLWSLNFSLIDVYLIVIDYLQKTANKKHTHIRNIFYKNICEIDDFKNIILKSIYDDEYANKYVNEYKSDKIEYMLQAYENGNYEQLISVFLSNDFEFYTSFNCYKITALSYLFLSKTPEKSQRTLCSKILELVYIVLKSNSENAVNAIFHLATLSRALRTFEMYKGICVFLYLFANYDMGCSFHEATSSLVDLQIDNYEISTNNVTLLPYKAKYLEISKEERIAFLENEEKYVLQYADAKFYFKQAAIGFEIENLIEKNHVEEATSLLVESYAENKLLVYTVDVSGIIDNIQMKIRDGKELTLGQVCYAFIDFSLSEIRQDCFLDLFDYTGFDTPLQLAQNSTESKKIIYFFLDEVCTVSILPSMYRIFNSTEEAEEYRIHICEFLLEKEDYPYKKHLRAEIEKNKKNHALSKKLMKVDKSRITINADSFKTSCYDAINEEVDRYNSTKAIILKLELLEDGTFQTTFVKNHEQIIKKMFGIYCREFCFGNHGLDMSLSTRVRHGALSNHIIKVLDDNHLVCDGHGSNEYIDTLIKSKVINPNVQNEMLNFSSKIQKLLDEFTKRTLKVILDSKITDAYFQYDFSDNDLNELFETFERLKVLTVDDTVMIINDFLVNITNIYLEGIRTEKLPMLQNQLIENLTELSLNIKKYILVPKEEKTIERLIIDCKTSIQNEFLSVSQWFYLSEYNTWENYTFNELIEMCLQIDKDLFSNFNKVKFKNHSYSDDLLFKGETFRYFIDILLIIVNNAIIHSDFKDCLDSLFIDCYLTTDSKYIYLAFENNLNDSIDREELDKIIEKINDDFQSKTYINVNTRQEGGMGLYKIMYTLFVVLKYGNSFYISRNEDIFRIEIQLKKEIIYNYENIDC